MCKQRMNHTCVLALSSGRARRGGHNASRHNASRHNASRHNASSHNASSHNKSSHNKSSHNESSGGHLDVRLDHGIDATCAS